MTSLANFFDHPLERRTSAANQPVSPPLPNVAQQSPSPIEPPPPIATTCHHLPRWLDAYGTWRCELCEPPILESQVRDRRTREADLAIVAAGGVAGVSGEAVGVGGVSDISGVKKHSAENFQLELSRCGIFIDVDSACTLPGIDPFELLAEVPGEPCSNCSSLAFWWTVLGERRCQRCQPPMKSREFFKNRRK